MANEDTKGSPARRRILARKAALASLAGLAGVGGAGACAHEQEPTTITVEPLAPASTAARPSASAVASAAPTATVNRRAPPPDDDDMIVRHPMPGHDPVGPPHVLPPAAPWSTLLGKATVSSKAQLTGGKRIVEVTIVFASPLRRNDQRVEQNVTGATVVKPTFSKNDHGHEAIVFTLEPNPGNDPVQIMLGVVDDQGQRWGHAFFEVTGAKSGAVGQSLPGKLVRLDN